jgi:hypothetical protein
MVSYPLFVDPEKTFYSNKSHHIVAALGSVVTMIVSSRFLAELISLC